MKLERYGKICEADEITTPTTPTAPTTPTTPTTPKVLEANGMPHLMLSLNGHPHELVSDEKGPPSLGSTSLRHRETMRDVLKHETFFKDAGKKLLR